jgi:proteic killer suppression protein
MIRSFRNKGLERFATTGDPSRLSVPNAARVRRILGALDVAATPQQMNVPGWRFHALQGQAKGRFAVDASGNWRITFGWDEQDAIDVDLEDYH